MSVRGGKLSSCERERGSERLGLVDTWYLSTVQRCVHGRVRTEEETDRSEIPVIDDVAAK